MSELLCLVCYDYRNLDMQQSVEKCYVCVGDFVFTFLTFLEVVGEIHKKV